MKSSEMLSDSLLNVSNYALTMIEHRGWLHVASRLHIVHTQIISFSDRLMKMIEIQSDIIITLRLNICFEDTAYIVRQENTAVLCLHIAYI